MVRRYFQNTIGFAIACASTAPAWCQDAHPRELYLLMGQSNMSGRGDIAEIKVGTLNPDPRIMMYGNDGVWKIASEPVDSAQGQIDKISEDVTAGVGPGLAFAKALPLKHPLRQIGLIPCAKGGTGIAEWAPSNARTTLYGSCLARAKEAVKEGRIVGMLWYQGETDAHDETRANLWAEKFTAMIVQFRSDLGQPKLPLVIVGLGDQPINGKFAGWFPGWKIVQDAQRKLRLPDQAYVSAAGMARNPDELHLSTASEIRIGKALARKMTALRRRQ